jgi:hypothetical protein
VRDADRWEAQHCTEVECEAGTAGMVSAGGVDHDDIRLRGKGSEGGFQQRPLSEGQQPWLVRCARSAGYDHRLAVDTRGCPRRVARVAGAGAASGEADEDAADPRARLEPPRRRVERGQA